MQSIGALKRVDDNIAKVVGGVAVAGLSAVTFVAYKHPLAFKKLANVLWLSIFSVMIAIGIWDLSNLAAKISVASSDHVQAHLEVEHDVEAYSIGIWWFLALCIANGYVWVLWSLPFWLLDDKTPQDQDDNK